MRPPTDQKISSQLDGTDYKTRLYQSYCSDHLSRAKQISVETIAYDLPLLRRTVRPFLPPDKDAEILDLGCAYGGLVHCISQLGFSHVTGVDLSVEMVALAHKLGIAGV